MSDLQKDCIARITEGEARSFASSTLAAAGLNPVSAEVVADTLVWTSLRGIDTHGLRLLPAYITELKDGRAKLSPNMTLTRAATSVSLLDADEALGILAGHWAAEEACRLANAYGVGVVSVRNSNHFGAASAIGRRIVEQGHLAIVMTSAASRVAAFGGGKPLLGTNPICICAQIDDDQQFCLDMATSQLSFGLIKRLFAAGEDLPHGSVVRHDGQFATALDEMAALAPLGGYKGQGLGMAVSLLCAVLSGMPCDWNLTDFDAEGQSRGRSIGHFLLALDPRVFLGREAYEAGFGDLINRIRGSDPHVLVPGDLESIAAKRRRRDGIPLDAAEVAAFERLAAGTGIRLGLEMDPT